MLCLVGILFPFISAVSVLEGVKAQSNISAEEGADIYVTMDMFGRNGMIPAAMAGEIEKLDGVIEAVPRVISRIYIEGKLAVLAGIPADEAPAGISFVQGALPDAGEIVVGRGMAESLNLTVGDNLSIGVRIIAILDHAPYIQKKVFRISGIFDADSGIWSSDLVLMDLDEAVSIFEMDDFVTDLAVYVRPGYTAAVVENIQKINSFLRIQTKDIVRSYIKRGFNKKGGIFVTFYTVAFALAIPALLVISGFGLSERKKEVGIIKATGWQTHEVMEMVFFENIILSLAGASVALLLSFVWIKLLNAPFIGQIFIAEIGSIAPFSIPAHFMPMPVVLAFFFSLILTMVGSIYSTWRAAIVPPVEAMK